MHIKSMDECIETEKTIIESAKQSLAYYIKKKEESIGNVEYHDSNGWKYTVNLNTITKVEIDTSHGTSLIQFCYYDGHEKTLTLNEYAYHDIKNLFPKHISDKVDKWLKEYAERKKQMKENGILFI